MRFIDRLRLAVRVLVHDTGGLYEHAEQELGPNMDIELRELLLVFSSQGHSGASAAVTADILGKLLRFEPVSPLTGADDEWIDVSKMMGRPTLQNKRCGRVFREGGLGFNGRAYDISGIIWEEPDGTRFTSFDSEVTITFPYTPKQIVKPVSERGL